MQTIEPGSMASLPLVIRPTMANCPPLNRATGARRMVKVLSGVVAAIVVAVGGFFGFEFYMQHRVAGEVEAVFEQIRATGGEASHGKVSFDLLSRTVIVADMVGQSPAQPPVSRKSATLTASGLSPPDAARFSADHIEAPEIELGWGGV